MATITLESIATAANSPFLAPTSDGRARFTRETYRRMYEAGVFGADPHVELLDGEIMMMSPIGPMHGALVRRLTWFFIKNLPDTIGCSAQLPIVAGDHSEPEADLALVRRRDDDYQREHPSPSDVVLLIEVSESSLRLDLVRKLQLYAAIGIAEYWVVDVAKRSVLIHREPTANSYASIEIFGVATRLRRQRLPCAASIWAGSFGSRFSGC
jgi:Uma2 family endonuclease